VVIGKDDADIGEILKESGNPTFRPGNSESVKLAVIKAIQLSASDYGKVNQQLAINNWGVDKIGKMYTELFKECINTNHL